MEIRRHRSWKMKKSILFLVFLAFFAGLLLFKNKFERRSKIQEVPKISSKETKYETLTKLSPQVQISYFKNLLDEPVYINDLKNFNKKEYIFTDKDYFVQAITDLNDKVLLFSVVSRSKDFNPTYEITGIEPPALKVSLNKTSFNDAFYGKEPLACYRFLGAHTPVYYFEEGYFGNPGKYLTYYIGHTDSGWSEGGLPGLTESTDPSKDIYDGSFDCNLVNKEDRMKLKPNIYAVQYGDLGLKAGEDIPMEFFGPQYILVRTLRDN